MKKFLLVGLIILFSVGIRAQEAKVKFLSEVDTAEAKAAYEKFVQAEKEWKAVQAKIKRTYLVPDKSWLGDFEFSQDFRVIVPVQIKWSGTSTLTYPCGTILTFGTASTALFSRTTN